MALFNHPEEYVNGIAITNNFNIDWYNTDTGGTITGASTGNPIPAGYSGLLLMTGGGFNEFEACLTDLSASINGDVLSVTVNSNGCQDTDAIADCAGEAYDPSWQSNEHLTEFASPQNTDDECGVCNGDNSSCSDCAGVPNGDAQMAEYWQDNDGDGLGAGIGYALSFDGVDDLITTPIDADRDAMPSYLVRMD